ncbi:MAG: hypothetical protein K8S99_00335 [Planctomycetes bacterium]|nr:hypothetical protein [Planctomycetota bacterium]
MTGPDFIVDIDGLRKPEPAPAVPNARPWLAVHWRCCHVYNRIYRNRDGSAYEGRCPSCGRPVRATIGAGGTDKRFFEAG